MLSDIRLSWLVRLPLPNTENGGLENNDEYNNNNYIYIYKYHVENIHPLEQQ